MRELMTTERCLMSGETNRPMMGLVFDNLSAVYLLTKPTTFVSQDLFFDCIQRCIQKQDYFAFEKKAFEAGLMFNPEPVNDEQRAIIFRDDGTQRVNRWTRITGAALFSYILPPTLWYEGAGSRGNYVKIRDGLLIQGRLTKEFVGTVRNAITQEIYMQYGPKAAGVFITNASFILNEWFSTVGFSIGIADCKPMVDAMAGPRARLNAMIEKNDFNGLDSVVEEIEEIVEQLEHSKKGYKMDSMTIGSIESAIKAIKREANANTVLRLHKAIDISHGAQIRRAVGEAKLKAKSMAGFINDPLEAERREDAIMQQLNIAKALGDKVSIENLAEDNPFNVMANSGAKGSAINTAQITSLVGTIVVEGKRLPQRLTGGTRTLPYFEPGSDDPESRGFIVSSFLGGLSLPELMFSQAGGREGLIDTGTKTAVTGEMQRDMVKAMEGVVTHYDRSVRNPVGNVIQPLYGHDGFAPRELQFVTTSKGAKPTFVKVESIVQRLNSKYAQMVA